jgi:hypothetical protein
MCTCNRYLAFTYRGCPMVISSFSMTPSTIRHWARWFPACTSPEEVLICPVPQAEGAQVISCKIFSLSRMDVCVPQGSCKLAFAPLLPSGATAAAIESLRSHLCPRRKHRLLWSSHRQYPTYQISSFHIQGIPPFLLYKFMQCRRNHIFDPLPRHGPPLECYSEVFHVS